MNDELDEETVMFAGQLIKHLEEHRDAAFKALTMLDAHGNPDNDEDNDSYNWSLYEYGLYSYALALIGHKSPKETS